MSTYLYTYHPRVSSCEATMKRLVASGFATDVVFDARRLALLMLPVDANVECPNLEEDDVSCVASRCGCIGASRNTMSNCFVTRSRPFSAALFAVECRPKW